MKFTVETVASGLESFRCAYSSWLLFISLPVISRFLPKRSVNEAGYIFVSSSVV